MRILTIDGATRVRSTYGSVLWQSSDSGSTHGGSRRTTRRRKRSRDCAGRTFPQVTTAGHLWKPAMRGGGNMTTKDDAPCGWSMTIAESQRMKGRGKSSIASDSFLAEFGHDVTGNLQRLPVMNRPCRDVSGTMWRKIRDDRTV